MQLNLDSFCIFISKILKIFTAAATTGNSELRYYAMIFNDNAASSLLARGQRCF